MGTNREMAKIEIRGESYAITLPVSPFLNPEIQYRFRPRDFAHRLIKKHQLGAHLIGELEDKLCQVQRQLSLEQSGGDAIVSDFDLDSALGDIDQLERKANEAQHKKKDSIFDASKFETIRRLVQADAITNLVQLE